MQGIKSNFYKVSKCISSRYQMFFQSLPYTETLKSECMCDLSFKCKKSCLVELLCHLLPTVANYCTNSLQRSDTQTHTFANTYTVHRSIHKYHVTGQWVPSPEVREAADLPLGWTPPETDKSATDCSWHNLYGNLTGHTEPVLLGAASTARQGWQSAVNERFAKGATACLRKSNGHKQWMDECILRRMDEWKVPKCFKVTFRGLKCHSCRNVH